MAWYTKLKIWITDRIHLQWITEHIHFINVFIMLTVILAGYVPFILHLVGHKTDTVSRQPACQSKCSVNIPRSSVDEFNSSSLKSIQVLFVHFSGDNLSLEPSANNDILDPLNLVYVQSTEAPFLYLNLGFNVYSFTTLSRVVHHMKVKVDVEPINCLQNMSYSCVAANLARPFLSNLTKEKGVLCYTVNDTYTVNYRCCKGNVDTQQVECDIHSTRSPEMATILITMIIAGAIAFLCFPALFYIVPYEKNSETLCSNNQVHNPIFLLIINTTQSLRHYSTKYYCVNVLRKLLIVLALPTLYYIDYGLQWYTMTYDIPKMFNDHVAKLWMLENSNMLPVVFTSNVIGVLVSLLPRIENLDFPNFEDETEIFSLLKKEKAIKVNWREPCVWTKYFFCWLRSLFGKAMGRSERSFCSRCAIFLGSVVLMALSPVITLLIFVSYTGYASPLGKMMRLLVYYAVLFFGRCFKKNTRGIYDVGRVGCLFFISVAFVFFSFSFGVMIYRPLILSTRLIAYLWMGLVASKDHYFPLITMLSVFVYYSWNCFSSVKSRYQTLLKQTFEKCKDYQERHPDAKKGLTFDDKGVPSIDSELFQDVINKILPRSVLYTNMILKLTAIILFLCLTFPSILVYGESNLNESTKALALFLTALLPKLFEVFGEGSSYQELCDTENACRVEKIVKDFLSRSHDANPDVDTPQNHNAGQSPSNPLGDQSSRTRTTTSEGHQRRGLDIEMAENAHVNPMEQNMNC